ncbi:MAG: oligosaccharide flippase family protein [Candidatus Pacebacteria bacterium]|nr:oligosaccharide flippase family protein [Candidatus Paceibacterota bacterium]MBP9832170.1 oligosaccharide flippase family protein [Candidatus Paceibacterota bacterium]
MLEEIKTRSVSLLRWSERYTKTDMVYLAGNGFWLALGQVGIGITALLISIAFARFIPKEVYGNYRFLLSIFWTLTAFSFTGISTVLARAIARGEGHAYQKSLRLSLIWSMPMVLIGLSMSSYYFLNGNAMLALGSLVIALIGPFMQTAYLYGSFLEGKQAFRDNAISGITLNAIPALALIASMFMVHDPVIFLLIYLSTSALTGFVISFIVVRKHHSNPNIHTAIESKEFGILSAHFSVMNILNTVSQQVDRILVFHYLGAVQLAIYAFATAIPEQIKTLFNSVATLALPRFVKRPLEETKKTLIYRLLGFSALAIIVIGFYILVAPLIFSVLFPAYHEAVFYSILYAISLVAASGVVPVALLEAHAAKRELYIYNTVGPVFQIAVLFAFVSTMGLLGAVIARILGRFFFLILGVVLTFIYAARVQKMNSSLQIPL